MVDPPRRLAAALAGAGAVLCVIGWYQISGQPTVAQQLPYLASATIPGAALLVVGLLLALRTPWSPSSARSPEVRRRTGEVSRTAAPSGGPGLLRVPHGRYLHSPDCPLLDGRTDTLAATVADVGAADVAAADVGAPTADIGAPTVGDEPPLRPCPLCRAGDSG